MRVMVSLLFAIEGLLTLAIARRLKLSRAALGLLLLSLLAYSRPQHEPPYNRLAEVFVLAALLSLLALAGDRRRTWPWLLGGLSAGLCLATKQNVGALCLAAVVAFAVHRAAVARTPGTWRGLALALAAAAGSAGAVLLPTAVNGGLPALVADGFANKGEYLQVWLHWWAQGQLVDRSSLPPLVDLAHNIYLGAPYAVVAAAVVTVLVAWFRSPDRGRLLLPSLFAGVGIGAMIPGDLFHVAVFLPSVLFGLAVGLREVPLAGGLRKQRILGLAAAGWLAAGILLLIATPAVRLMRGEVALSASPHMRGVPLPAAQAAAVERDSTALRQAGQGHTLYLLGDDAGLYYLTAGIPDPTPYDWPAPSTFGQDGERSVTLLISSGKVDSVCVTRDYATGSPRLPVVDYVTGHLRPRADLGYCTLYAGSA